MYDNWMFLVTKGPITKCLLYKFLHRIPAAKNFCALWAFYIEGWQDSFLDDHLPWPSKVLGTANIGLKQLIEDGKTGDLKFEVQPSCVDQSNPPNKKSQNNNNQKCFVFVRSVYSELGLGGNLDSEKPEKVGAKLEFEGVLVLTIPPILPGGLSR